MREVTYEDIQREIRLARGELNQMRNIVNALVNIIIDVESEYDDLVYSEDNFILYT